MKRINIKKIEENVHINNFMTINNVDECLLAVAIMFYRTTHEEKLYATWLFINLTLILDWFIWTKLLLILMEMGKAKKICTFLVISNRQKQKKIFFGHSVYIMNSNASFCQKKIRYIHTHFDFKETIDLFLKKSFFFSRFCTWINLNSYKSNWY